MEAVFNAVNAKQLKAKRLFPHSLSLRSLTSNQLKIIATLAMILDHCVVVFIPQDLSLYPLLRLPGRLTAPIMCFLVAEGYYHTSDLRRYMGRLLKMAIISHLPFVLCFGFHPLKFWLATDVMWSLLLGLISLAIYHSSCYAAWQKILLIGLCCLLAYPADWNYIAVLMILSFGVFRNQPNKQTVAHIAVGCLYLAQAFFYDISALPRLGIFISIPLLRCYNGERGRKSKAIQYGFYWFYPIRLLLLYGVSQLFSI